MILLTFSTNIFYHQNVQVLLVNTTMETEKKHEI